MAGMGREEGGGGWAAHAFKCRNKCQPRKKTPKIKTIFASAKSLRRLDLRCCYRTLVQLAWRD